MPRYFHNATLLSGGEWLPRCSMGIDAGRITSIEPTVAGAPGGDDLDGLTVIPGLVDLQVNGGGGILFNDAPCVETLERMVAAHAAFGTTAMLPTLISDTADTMQLAMDAVRNALRANMPGIAGIHLEGPFLDPAKRGVHNSHYFRPLTDADIDMLASLGAGSTLVTMSPAHVTPEQVATLVDCGVHVWAGHSNASCEQTRAALDAGMSGFTHLFNAMSPMESRRPGMVGAALTAEHAHVGLIADGQHVDPVVLAVTLRARGPDAVCLVTDAMSVVGSNEGRFMLDGNEIRVEDGCCRNAAGTLAGSALTMIDAVDNMMRFAGVNFATAVRMASSTPARALGIEAGELAVGRPASFCLCDSDRRIVETWIDGQRMFAAPGRA